MQTYFTQSMVRQFSTVILPFRFLYDKSSVEYLYYKNKVAELRKDMLKPENPSDNGKTTTFQPFFNSFLFLCTVIEFLTEHFRWPEQEQPETSHCLFEVSTLTDTVLLRSI